MCSLVFDEGFPASGTSIRFLGNPTMETPLSQASTTLPSLRFPPSFHLSIQAASVCATSSPFINSVTPYGSRRVFFTAALCINRYSRQVETSSISGVIWHRWYNRIYYNKHAKQFICIYEKHATHLCFHILVCILDTIWKFNMLLLLLYSCQSRVLRNSLTIKLINPEWWIFVAIKSLSI